MSVASKIDTGRNRDTEPEERHQPKIGGSSSRLILRAPEKKVLSVKRSGNSDIENVMDRE